MRYLVLAAVVPLVVAACGGPMMPVDQAKLCLFSTDEQARQCEDGQIVYFKPAQARSPQAILNVAAAYCDFNHPVVHNDGGLLCVMTRERLSLVGQ